MLVFYLFSKQIFIVGSKQLLVTIFRIINLILRNSHIYINNCQFYYSL